MVQKTLRWKHEATGHISSKVREKKAMSVHLAFIIIKLSFYLLKNTSLWEGTHLE